MSTIIHHTSEDGIQKFELVKHNESKYKRWFAVPGKKVKEYLHTLNDNGYFIIKNEMGCYVVGENNHIVADCFEIKKGFYTFQVLKEIYKGK
jgi:tagatose-1,6-bisphosphate aldolase